MAMVSYPYTKLPTTAMSEMMAVMGTCPLRAPDRLSSASCGESCRRTTSSSRPACAANSIDQGMGIDGEQSGAQMLQRLDEHHRVLARRRWGPRCLPGRPERPAGMAGAGPGAEDRSRRPDVHRSGHGQAVGHRELPQSLVIEVVVEAVPRVGSPVVLDDHHRRSGGLVVAGPGGDVQVHQGPLHTGRRPDRGRGGRGLEGDGLDEPVVVAQGVPERDGPRVRGRRTDPPPGRCRRTPGRTVSGRSWRPSA